MRTPYAMYVFSPTMQSAPIHAGPRMWTLSHTDVPGPNSTPVSTSAVGWMRGAADEAAAEDAVAAAGANVAARGRAPARRSRIPFMSTHSHPPEWIERYAASTAATVRRHSTVLIHGVPPPVHVSTKQLSMRRWASILS